MAGGAAQTRRRTPTHTRVGVMLGRRLSESTKMNDFPFRAKQQDALLHSPVMSWQSNKKGDKPLFPLLHLLNDVISFTLCKANKPANYLL